MWISTWRGRSRLMFLFFSAVVGLGGAGKCNYRTPPEYKRIFDLPSQEQQRADFKKLPLKKQIDMFVYAMYTEPPQYMYVDYLASDGQAVIPELLARLEQETDDGIRVEFIRVFRQIHRKYYDLHNSPEVIEKLKVESDKITDREYRQESEEYIASITGST